MYIRSREDQRRWHEWVNRQSFNTNKTEEQGSNPPATIILTKKNKKQQQQMEENWRKDENNVKLTVLWRATTHIKGDCLKNESLLIFGFFSRKGLENWFIITDSLKLKDIVNLNE